MSVTRVRVAMGSEGLPVRAPILVLCCLTLAGCGLVAAPCRVGSAALKIVPVAGQVAAAPTDACANAIDPTPTKS